MEILEIKEIWWQIWIEEEQEDSEEDRHQDQDEDDQDQDSQFNDQEDGQHFQHLKMEMNEDHDGEGEGELEEELDFGFRNPEDENRRWTFHGFLQYLFSGIRFCPCSIIALTVRKLNSIFQSWNLDCQFEQKFQENYVAKIAKEGPSTVVIAKEGPSTVVKLTATVRVNSRFIPITRYKEKSKVFM